MDREGRAWAFEHITATCTAEVSQKTKETAFNVHRYGVHLLRSAFAFKLPPLDPGRDHRGLEGPGQRDQRLLEVRYCSLVYCAKVQQLTNALLFEICSEVVIWGRICFFVHCQSFPVAIESHRPIEVMFSFSCRSIAAFNTLRNELHRRPCPCLPAFVPFPPPRLVFTSHSLPAVGHENVTRCCSVSVYNMSIVTAPADMSVQSLLEVAANCSKRDCWNSECSRPAPIVSCTINRRHWPIRVAQPDRAVPSKLCTGGPQPRPLTPLSVVRLSPSSANFASCGSATRREHVPASAVSQVALSLSGLSLLSCPSCPLIHKTHE